MKENLVSIITPLYNSELYIEETLKAIQSQTYKEWEVIVIDDNSTDNGAEIVKKYAKNDGRIKYIRLEKNSGGAVARNRGIEEAQGRYIAFLDSDDLWVKDKLEKQIKFMQENKYEFSFTKYQQMKENGEKINKFIEVPAKLNYRQALLKNPIGCLTVIYDCNIMGKIYLPIIRKRQDYALWLKILKKGIIGHGLNESLAYYRLRENSVSSNKIQLIKYQWQLYRKIEKLNLCASIFYLSCVIFQKIFKIK